MLWIRAALFAALLPGTATVVVPALLRLSGLGRLELGPWRWAGLALVVPGALGLLWCIADFARVGRGTLAPVDAPRFVVKGGLYRVTRNPMYVSVVTIAAGEALLLDTWLLAAWGIALAALFNGFVMLYEEPALRRRFGAEYEAYCARVPRWW